MPQKSIASYLAARPPAAASGKDKAAGGAAGSSGGSGAAAAAESSKHGAKENSNPAQQKAASLEAERPRKRLRRAVIEDSPSPTKSADARAAADAEAALMDDDMRGRKDQAAHGTKPAGVVDARAAADEHGAALVDDDAPETVAEASPAPKPTATPTATPAAKPTGDGKPAPKPAAEAEPSAKPVAAPAELAGKPLPGPAAAAARTADEGPKLQATAASATREATPAAEGAASQRPAVAPEPAGAPEAAATPEPAGAPEPAAVPSTGSAKQAAKLAPIFAKPARKQPKRVAAAASPSKAAEGCSDDDQDDDVDEAMSGDDGEAHDDVVPLARGAGSAKAAKRAGAAAASKKAAKASASAVEGVGKGAVEAAQRHDEFVLEDAVKGRWAAGKPVPFELLADTFEEIAETSRRLDIVLLLINCFRAIIATTPEDLLPAVYLCTNRVAPAHHGIELGVGDSTIFKAIAAATGRTEARIKEQAMVDGDLGIVAVKLRATQRTLGMSARLTVRGVVKAFKDVALASGKASQKVKEGFIVKMLVASKGNEPGYVIRFAQAKLRIGLAEQSVLTALAHAVHLQLRGAGGAGSNKDGQLANRLEAAAQMVKQAYSECPAYDVLIPALLAHPMEELPAHVHFMPGVPVRPMLAKATNGVTEVLDKFQDQQFTCEYKYDGERAQVHVLDDGSVRIYSRNSENNTGKYPDIVSRMKTALKPGVKSIVIDAEAVAWDVEKKKILPFQVLSTRKRKDVDVGKIDVQVCLFVFDCLFLNGRSLLREPMEERRVALYDSLECCDGQVQFATAKTSRDVEELQRFLDEAVDGCTEGLIVKTMRDTYEPSKRSSHWLKLKKDYLEGVGDTIDVVPIGAWHGKGKRTGVFGAYLLAIYDPDSESYQTISKIGTGFSEERLAELSETLAPHIIPEPRRYFSWTDNPSLKPDVWFDAAVVWEVKAADLSISPVHKAASGLVDPSKGISIRFPRLVRVRDDKSPEDATNAEQIADMFRAQAYHKPDAAPEGDDDE